MTSSVDSELAEQSFPLSFAQERLWLLQQIEPDCVAYHVPLGIRLIGPLNLPALEKSLSELVRRHEVLRAVVLQTEGTPCQVIRPPHDVHLDVVDVSAESDRDKENVLRRLATREVQKSFNLSEGPSISRSLVQGQ